jgi:hypothetical protein
MALQSLIGGAAWYPTPFYSIDAPSMSSTLVMDAVNEMIAFIFRAPKTGNIDRVGCKTGDVSVTAGPLTFTVRLETVTNGLPSGTLVGTDTNVNWSVATGDDFIWKEHTLTAAAAVTKGQIMALLFTAPAAGTFSVPLHSFINSINTTSFPYCATRTGAGSWTKNLRNAMMNLRYDDGVYACPEGFFPFFNVSSSAIGSGSTPDEVGNRFTVPFKCKLRSLTIWIDRAATTDFTVRVYDSADSVLIEQTIDSDDHVDLLENSEILEMDDEITLEASTLYRVTFRPNTTTQTFYYCEPSTAAMMDAFAGGQNIHATHRTDGGAWTDTTTRRYFISLGLSAFDDGASAGGGGEASAPCLTFSPFG